MRQVIKNPLEDAVTLLQYIGRDEEERGESGFNVGVELNPGNRLNTYQFLERAGYVETFDREEISDMDGSAIFIKCRLTEKGKVAYEKIEREFSEFVNRSRLEGLD